MASPPPEVMYFASSAEFRQWLEANHRTAAELWVGYYKKGSGVPSMSWPESQEQALCFGWIDGVRMSIDETRYANRFSPRRPGSNWSEVNIRRVAELRAAGLMTDAGEAAFAARDLEKRALYSYENRHTAAFDPELDGRFRANAAAWEFFQSQPPGYRSRATYWVMSAKRAETRENRLAQLIDASVAGHRIRQLSQPAR